MEGITVALGIEAMRDLASRSESPKVQHTPMERERMFLRPDEANRVIAAAGQHGRCRLRDVVLLRLIYRHGLRCTEAINARWTDFQLEAGEPLTFYVRRLKGSRSTTHTLDRDEATGLRKLKADSDGAPQVFVTERGGPLSPDTVARIIARAGEAAGIGFHLWPHLLRHSAGYFLANSGVDMRLIQEHLGHANVQNTTRYTAVAPHRLAAVRVR